MADSGGAARRDGSPSSRPASTKARPRTQASEQLADHSSGYSKKLHRRSATIVSISGDKTTCDQSPSQITTFRERPESGPIKTPPASPEKVEAVRNPSAHKSIVKDASSQSKSLLSESVRPSDTTKTSPANESEGSSGSNDTIAPVRRDSFVKGNIPKPRKHQISKQPNALNFLDADSPQITSESIQRTVKEALKPSPDVTKTTSPSSHSISSTSSGPRDDPFDPYGDHETELSTSPEHSIDGDPGGRASDKAGPRPRVGKGRKRSYGTPEMPRGNMQHSHLSPEDLTPRVPNQHFMKPLPRAEKLPLTGYELLASRLSAGSFDRNGLPLRPIYRRFEALNHRILLHLQDEICELEEQLHHIDTADTQNRRLQTGILPASRRAEYLSNGEFQWHKNDTIWKIAFKLDQYSKVTTPYGQFQSLTDI